MIRFLLVLLCTLLSASLRAQPAPDQEGEPTQAGAPAAAAPTPAPEEEPAEDVLTPMRVDRASCAPLDLTPGALLQATTDEFALATPIPWSEFVVEGRLVDSKATVHTLLEPTLQQYRTSLSLATLPELAATIARFGYQLVGHRTIDIPNGQRLVLHVAPLPLVRRVNIAVEASSWREGLFGKLLEDELRRRMSLRVGSYLPWEPIRRQCALLEEQRRLEEYLYDEGYYEATVKVVPALDVASANLRVKVELGAPYNLGKVTIACPSGTERRGSRCVDTVTNVPYAFAIPEADIRAAFNIEQNCILKLCYDTPPFRREEYQGNILALKKRFQDVGYPSVRVVASDPRLGVQRKTNTVDLVVTIDQRRRIDVEFKGHNRDVVNETQLRKQLTFNLAGSADEVEIGESARALTTYLQTRGFFDARVTWTRERIDTEPRPNTKDTGLHFDRVVFIIAMGERRRVVNVEFVGNKAISTEALRDLVATKESNIGGRLFGTVLAATSAELIIDQDRIKEAYRRMGYLDVRVWPSASPTAGGLDNAALTATLIGLDTGNSLHVRYTIEEGSPTLLSRIVVTGESNAPIDPSLCGEVLGELATRLGNRDAAVRAPGEQCTATVRDLKYRGDDFGATRDQLRDYLLRNGRGRAVVTYETKPIGPARVQAHYTVSRTERLKLGKVVVRGNSRTQTSVIYDVLDFDEGQLLTSDRLAQGARRLRSTGLFNSVSIEMPELDCDDVQRSCNSDVINAVVRVEERHEYRYEIGVEFGYSTQNGGFVTGRVARANIGGYGISLSLAATEGQKLKEYEARLRFPRWLWPLPGPPFNTAITTLHRELETERFGPLTTQSAALELAWVDPKPRTDEHAASVLSIGPSYAFRLISRNVDAIRPIGADMDEPQVAVRYRASLLGLRVDHEQRVDRNGQLQPLAPEAGHHLEALVSFAEPWVLGQDKFVKMSLSGSKFIPIGSNAVLRADLRYDHGVPLGGAVLLPEVERFFAGGDSTVRGYSNERLATEIVQVGVPPLDNISQVRIIPAGGNIRVLASLDAQVRIWRILAGALFTDAGLITNQWSTVEVNRKWGFVPDIPQLRPSVGMGLRFLTPFGIGALEYAVPLSVQLGDDPRGKIHFYFAARAQF